MSGGNKSPGSIAERLREPVREGTSFLICTNAYVTRALKGAVVTNTFPERSESTSDTECSARAEGGRPEGSILRFLAFLLLLAVAACGQETSEDFRGPPSVELYVEAGLEADTVKVFVDPVRGDTLDLRLPPVLTLADVDSVHTASISGMDGCVLWGELTAEGSESLRRATRETVGEAAVVLVDGELAERARVRTATRGSVPLADGDCSELEGLRDRILRALREPGGEPSGAGEVGRVDSFHRAGARHLARAEDLRQSGRTAESERFVARAESAFLRGAARRVPGRNPNVQALRALADDPRWDRGDFEDYVPEIERLYREGGRQRVLAQRLDPARPIPAFELKALDGSVVRSDALVGSVVMIDFWGTWCTPCIPEMPEIQRLHERYRDEPAVHVLTIAVNEPAGRVQEWMRERGFDFPVLIADGYAQEAGVTAFPTKWYVDETGGIAFEAGGASSLFPESAEWRIQALLSDREGLRSSPEPEAGKER